MARDYEIKSAFMNAIKTDLKRGQVVSAADFVAELEKLKTIGHCDKT